MIWIFDGSEEVSQQSMCDVFGSLINLFVYTARRNCIPLHVSLDEAQRIVSPLLIEQLQQLRKWYISFDLIFQKLPLEQPDFVDGLLQGCRRIQVFGQTSPRQADFASRIVPTLDPFAVHSYDISKRQLHSGYYEISPDRYVSSYSIEEERKPRYWQLGDQQMMVAQQLQKLSLGEYLMYDLGKVARGQVRPLPPPAISGEEVTRFLYEMYSRPYYQEPKIYLPKWDSKSKFSKSSANRGPFL